MKKFKNFETIEDIIEDLENTLNCDVYLDTSRSWSLYTQDPKYTKGQVNKIGAFRGYLGGGIRGHLEHNGRKEYGTLTIGELFYNALTRIEELYNQGYEEEETWDRPSGILL